MDRICEKIIEVKAQISKLEDQIDELKLSIKDHMARVEEYFLETNREAPYVSPYGTLYIRKDMSIPQPHGEKLREIFTHFEKIYGVDLAWEKMSIHNATLKAEVKEHQKAVLERGGDPVLEPFPGVEQPKTIKTLQFRKTR